MTVRFLTSLGPAGALNLQVKDVLDAERLDKIRRGCEIAVREMVGRDPDRACAPGPHPHPAGGAAVLGEKHGVITCAG